MPAKFIVEDARKLDPFIVIVWELEPAEAVDGEMLVIVGSGFGGGWELPPPPPQAAITATIAERSTANKNFVVVAWSERLVFAPNAMRGTLWLGSMTGLK